MVDARNVWLGAVAFIMALAALILLIVNAEENGQQAGVMLIIPAICVIGIAANSLGCIHPDEKELFQ